MCINKKETWGDRAFCKDSSLMLDVVVVGRENCEDKSHSLHCSSFCVLKFLAPSSHSQLGPLRIYFSFYTDAWRNMLYALCQTPPLNLYCVSLENREMLNPSFDVVLSFLFSLFGCMKQESSEFNIFARAFSSSVSLLCA